jgi:lipopolysaccharide export system permease protein
MKKLDWYIIKKFIFTTFFILLMMSLIACIIDASEKTDDFVKAGVSTYQIITEYYAGFVPFIISMIFPLMVFIGVIFFTSQMASRSEIIAIIASGVHFNRFLRPYLVGAIILGGSFWWATQYLIPKANVLRGNFQATYIDSRNSYEIGQYYAKGNNYYVRLDSNTYAGLRSYDTSSKTANNGFFMEKLKGNQLVYNVRADYIKWDTAKKGWRAENVMERKIDGLKETIEVKPTMYISLDIKPTEIRPDKYLKDKMTTPELMKFIKAEEARGSEGLNEYKVERYRRDATPVSVLILTMIGVAVSSRKTRGGSGLNLAIGIVTASIFVIMDKFSLTFSTKGDFPPMLAAWMPNLVFSVIAFMMYRLAPK